MSMVDRQYGHENNRNLSADMVVESSRWRTDSITMGAGIVIISMVEGIVFFLMVRSIKVQAYTLGVCCLYRFHSCVRLFCRNV